MSNAKQWQHEAHTGSLWKLSDHSEAIKTAKHFIPNNETLSTKWKISNFSSRYSFVITGQINAACSSQTRNKQKNWQESHEEHTKQLPSFQLRGSIPLLETLKFCITKQFVKKSAVKQFNKKIIEKKTAQGFIRNKKKSINKWEKQLSLSSFLFNHYSAR